MSHNLDHEEAIHQEQQPKSKARVEPRKSFWETEDGMVSVFHTQAS